MAAARGSLMDPGKEPESTEGNGSQSSAGSRTTAESAASSDEADEAAAKFTVREGVAPLHNSK
eukprot:jgi/Undpi1/10572/HiC_scaffold_29.g13022.m1